MEFLRAVEDDLRALSVEARKKHPVVKEAAERGIVRLRALREQYAAAVRESGGESPPTSRLRSQELLRPFLLACNHVDAGKAMTLHALGAIAHLMNKDAISPADAPNILRVLAIQAVAPPTAASAAGGAPDVQVKVLQTLLLTVTWRACELPEEVLASALIVCLQLTEHRHATVRNAASATLRQVVSLMFDRVAGEDGTGVPVPGPGASGGEVFDASATEPLPQLPSPERPSEAPGASPRGEAEEAAAPAEGGAPAWARPGQGQGPELLMSPRLEGMRPVERCAYYLIQDLCLICRGEGATWLKHMAVSQSLGMELIEQILAQHPKLFRERAEFGEVLRNQVCPLIVQTLRSGDELDFPLLVRLMRTIATVLAELADALVPQCEVILAMLFQLLASVDLAAAAEAAGSGGGGGGGGGSSSVVGAAASNLAATANSLLGAAVASLGSGSGGGGGSGGRGASGRMGLWTVMLALEVLGGACAQPSFVLTAFANYDCLAECTNVLAGMVKGLSRFVVEGSLASPGAAASLLAAAAACPWSAKGLPQLSRGFELMKETSPPPITEGEALLQAVGALLALADTVWGAVLDRQLGGQLKPAIPSFRFYHPTSSSSPATEAEADAATGGGAQLHRMLVKEDVWQDLLRVLAHLLTHVSPSASGAPSSSSSAAAASSAGGGQPGDRLFDHALLGLERLCLALGVLGVVPAETQVVSLVAKLSVPTLAAELTFPAGGSGSSSTATTTTTPTAAAYALTPRHLRAVKCLLRVVTFLANGLGAKSWESVVEAFDLLDACLYASGAPAASSSPPVPAGGGDAAAGMAAASLGGGASGGSGGSLHNIPTDSRDGGGAGGAKGGSAEEQKLANVLRRFVCFSALLEDAALAHLVGAYVSHGEALLQAEESPPFGGGGATRRGTAAEQQAPASSGFNLLPAALAAAASAAASAVAPPPLPGPAGPAGPGSSVAAPDRSVTAAALVLRQVVKVAAFNMYRYEGIATAVAGHLAFVAGTHSPALRLYAVSALADLVTKALGRGKEGGGGSGGLREKLDAGVGYPTAPPGAEGAGGGGGGGGGGAIGMVGYDLETLFLVRAELEGLPSLRAGEESEGGQTQVQLLRPLASLGSCPYVDARAHALQALHRILQSCGHVLDEGWPEVFDLLCAVAVSASPAPPPPPQPSSPRPLADGGEAGEDAPPPPAVAPAALGVPAVPPLWGDACLPLAFRSLKLVVDDNLDSVPRAYLGACVQCLGAFGAQPLDVNASLTAVGMVWSVADFVARPRGEAAAAAAATAATDEAVVWPAILSELGKLALDARPEVRNCAVNTLFACLVAHGAAFAPDGWGARAAAVGDLMAAIEERAWAASGEELSGMSVSRAGGGGGGAGGGGGGGGSGRSAPKVVMHHSRDTAQKQWAETRVLAMQGLGRLHRAFLRPFWARAWYPPLWARTLATARAAVAPGARAPNAEVALAGANLLFLQLQLASRAGLAHGPLRAAAGMKVVDGALQQAGASGSGPPRQLPGSAPESPDGRAASEEFEAAKAKLWEEAWAALRGAAAGYCEDPEGEVAAAFVVNLQTIYEGAKAAELQGPARMLEFLELVQSLVEARLPVLPPSDATGADGGAAGGAGGAGAALGLGGRNWRPPVLSNQREALTLLRAVRSEDARVWGRVFDLLTRLATAPHTNANAAGAAAPSSSQPPVQAVLDDDGAEALYYTRVPVSRQFAKEAADCLMELYSQAHVPLPARAGAFDAILGSLGGACLACSRARRRRRRGEWVAGLLGLVAPAMEEGGAGGGEGGQEQQEPSTAAAALPPISLPQQLAAVQASGALLTPVLPRGLEAVKACALAAGLEGEEEQHAASRRRGRSRSQEQVEEDRERRRQLQRAWHAAVRVVEGYLIPWQPAAGGKAGAPDATEQLLAALQQQPSSSSALEAPSGAAAAGAEPPASYAAVGAGLLRAVVEAVAASLDLALASGAVDQLVDLLVDALLAQSSLGLATGSTSSASSSLAAAVGEGQQLQQQQGVGGASGTALFDAILAHLGAVLAALVDRAVQPPVLTSSGGSKRGPPQRQPSSGAGQQPPQPQLHPPALSHAAPTEGEEDDAQAAVRAMAVRATRRLVAGVLHASRWIIDRYHAETKRADAPPHTYETAEAHVLALLAFLQSFRLPDWALPRAADVPAAALLGGSDAAASLLLVPEWVDPERQGPPPPLGHREPPALGHEDEAAAEDDEEDDDGDYHALQRGAAHPLPAHVFLLAPQVLRGCMGGGASSVVRAAALALLAGADLGGTFLQMRREVDRHRRALDDAGLEIAELRDQTARLSVSSVAGFF